MATRRNVSSNGFGCGMVILFVVIAVLIVLIPFAWFAETVIPLTEPTRYTTFGYGFIHGLFAVFSWFYSLINDSVTIYQHPNNGVEYNAGFLIGALVSLPSPIFTARLVVTLARS